MSNAPILTRRFLVASDFDQTLSFNDSGHILSEVLGISRFQEKVDGLARSNLVKVIPSLPARGLIFDSAGRPLVQNVPQFLATLTPSLIPAGPADAADRDDDEPPRVQSRSRSLHARRGGRGEHETLLWEAQIATSGPHDPPDERVEQDEERDLEDEQDLVDRCGVVDHPAARVNVTSVEPSVKVSPLRSLARLTRFPPISIPFVVTSRPAPRSAASTCPWGSPTAARSAAAAPPPRRARASSSCPAP